MGAAFDWVISDTHFLHARIVEYEPVRATWCDGTVEGMTEALIDAWRRVVKPDDRVLHLGDFFMGHKTRWAEIRGRLPGRITLVRGNHDPAIGSKHWAAFEPITVWDKLSFDHPPFGHIVCRHDPAQFTIEDAASADVLIHGHLHSGRHRDDVPEAVRAKCVCVSVERLLSQPAPMAFDLLDTLMMRNEGDDR